MLPSRFSAKLTWLNAVINGHSLKEEDYKVFETSGETRPDSLRKKRDAAATKTKTFWKIESPNAISWIHLGGTAKKKFFLGIKLFCFSR